jgi:hypothetical protein
MYKTKHTILFIGFSSTTKYCCMDLVRWIISFYSKTICIDYTSNFHTCHYLLLINDLQYMTYLILYLLGINSWFVLHQPWLWHFLKWNSSIINSRNVDVMYQLWYKKAFKTLQVYIGNTCYPDNIYASTMFLHAC